MPTRSNKLTDIIRNQLHDGALSFADYMALALYHPEYGYYTAPEITLGKQGDFTTAPEISPLFAMSFANQCLQILSQLDSGSILELGAGTGRFARDLLLSLEKNASLPEHYYILEISPSLRQKQRELLSHHPSLLTKVTWLDSLPQDFRGIIIANEVLDALPVHCFRVEADGIQERCVTWQDDHFDWQLRAPLSAELAEQAAHLRDTYELPSGYESEVNLKLASFITSLCHSLSQGVILLADYGYGQSEYYHPARQHGTLTGFYQHQRADNPFTRVGEQDITAHVDFTRVIEIASDQDCRLAGFTTQAAFLLACGLLDMASDIEKTLTPDQEVNFHQAIKILTMPTEMGEVIKIMGLAKNFDQPLMGFGLQDRRRDL